jgi:hypothetical protein
MVFTMDRVRTWLWRAACLENGFVDNVARIYGWSVPAERFPLRPNSLLVHGTVFHPWRYLFPRIWAWASTAWILRMEMDRYGHSHWCDRALLHSGTHFWTLSAR